MLVIVATMDMDGIILISVIKTYHVDQMNINLGQLVFVMLGLLKMVLVLVY